MVHSAPQCRARVFSFCFLHLVLSIVIILVIFGYAQTLLILWFLSYPSTFFGLLQSMKIFFVYLLYLPLVWGVILATIIF